MNWSMTDIPFPLFNSILEARLSPEEIDGAFQPILAQADARHVPLLCFTGPSTQPADLGSHLEKLGFADAGQMPGMAIHLAYLKEDLPRPVGLKVRQVMDDDTRRQWGQVCAAGFGMPDLVAEAFQDILCHADPETVLAYLGWQDDRPVATSLLILAAGVAGVYNVTTLPEARGQGLGGILSLAPLRAARKRDYKAAILQASKMGVNIYRSLGFLEYCKIGQYVWQPGS